MSDREPVSVDRPAPTSASAETPRWIRHRPTKAQNLAALGAGLGVGLVVGGVVAYLARLMLAREPLLPAPARGEREDA